MPPSEATAISKANSLKLVRIWYALGMMMLIAVAVVSLLPVLDVGVGGSDKFLHLLTYFLLAGWFGLLVRDRVMLGWTLAALIAYGALLELLQGQTGYRFAEWGDVVANSIGALAGVTLHFTLLRRLFGILDDRLSTIFSS
ncbi:MAG: VanZ family protein [Gammaproteobacteria bacterium]|nr:VanZ family protein [Gammaproteobacteria bacterium]